MTNLQRVLLETVSTIAAERGLHTAVEGPKWSVEFREQFFAVRIAATTVEGAVFPRDANFWGAQGLDMRFERIDYVSDDEMCAQLASGLRAALEQEARHV